MEEKGKGMSRRERRVRKRKMWKRRKGTGMEYKGKRVRKCHCGRGGEGDGG